GPVNFTAMVLTRKTVAAGADAAGAADWAKAGNTLEQPSVKDRTRRAKRARGRLLSVVFKAGDRIKEGKL
ncbi:MAG: hypothetical protein RIQ79_1217, partial [Verrucomicrobiota bacterium]